MFQCIYCCKSEPDVTFKKREHVIPAGLGGITMLPLGTVCDQCNNKFSKMELDLMRNSPIAISRQFEGPGKRGSFNINDASGLPINIFLDDNGIPNMCSIVFGNPIIINQIVFFDGKCKMFFKIGDKPVEDKIQMFIKALENFNGRYNEINFPCDLKDYMIFGYHKGNWYIASDDISLENINNKMAKIIAALKIKNISEPSMSNKEDPNIAMRLQFNTNDYVRVYAKIAINTLAYLKGKEIFLNDNFRNIIDYILTGEGNIESSILAEGIDLKVPLPEKCHKVLFSTFENKLISVLDFYGGLFPMAITMGEVAFNETSFFICDWKHKKEYTMNEYFRSLY